MANERQPLEDLTLRQLRKVASSYNISRYSRMRKSQLLAAIRRVEGQPQNPVSPSRPQEVKEEVEAAKFELGQDDLTGGALASVDEGLADLPSSYADGRIVLMPRDPQWCYTYWDVTNEQKSACRQQGGQQLALRIYDVTDISIESQSPHSVQEYPCDELAREWYLPIPVSDRDYVVDIGYRCADGRWLVIARSAAVRVPPIYPSDWIEDHFVTVPWERDLRGQAIFRLMTPTQRQGLTPGSSIYNEVFGLAEAAEAQRRAGSLYGSMQHGGASEQAVSSYVFPSGVGKWAASGVGMMSGAGLAQMSGVGLAQMSGVGMMSGVGLAQMSGVGMMSGVGLAQMSGVGMMSGVGLAQMSGVGMMSGVGLAQMSGVGMMSGIGMLSMSGVGMMSGIGMLSMSGVGMMSGVGFSASAVPIRPRQFWLVADAELIVYGATEPDATVTIGGRPIKLNPDGTFRFQMSFQDGLIDYPIMAVAADGEQMRSIHMKFERETPSRHTNTKDEAQLEWI